MITVYIAGASREAKRARMWAEKLEQTGVAKVAHRWFDGAEVWAGKDADWQAANTKESCAARAMHEIGCAAEADIVWVLWPKAPSIGVYVELGAALGEKRLVAIGVAMYAPRIVVTGPGFADSIFSAPADYREITDALGFHEVVRLANAGRRKG